MDARRRVMSRKVQPIRYQRNLIGTPPPIKGRRHENVQTEKYLEEVHFTRQNKKHNIF